MGILTIIANGRRKNILTDIIKGEKVGTIFYPRGKISNKRMWIKFSKSKGQVFIDDGAKKAIIGGKNLLPAGIIEVIGAFNKGDVVDISCSNKIIAKIITDYPANELRAIKGKNNSKIKEMFNKKINNIAKRENLVFME